MGKLIRNGIEYGGGNGTDIFEVTQAEYDALVQAGTLVHNALYVITDAQNLNPTANDIEYSSGVTVADKLDEMPTNLSDLTNNLEIGKIIKGTESGSVNVASASGTEVGSITLNKGKYVILGGIDWATNSTGFRQVAFAANRDPSRDAGVCQPACASPKETYQQIASFRDIQTDNTEIKLYGWQDSGSTLGAYAFIYAIKIY